MGPRRAFSDHAVTRTFPIGLHRVPLDRLALAAVEILGPGDWLAQRLVDAATKPVSMQRAAVLKLAFRDLPPDVQELLAEAASSCLPPARQRQVRPFLAIQAAYQKVRAARPGSIRR